MKLTKVAAEWVIKASNSAINATTFVECSSKAERRKLKNLIKEEIYTFSEIEPHNYTLHTSDRFQDHKHWVTIKKVGHTPTIGWVKEEGADPTKVIIGDKDADN